MLERHQRQRRCLMKEVKSVQEKRAHPRIAKDVPLKLKLDDYDIVTKTQNISCSGAYCTVDKYLEPLTKLRILLLLPCYKDKKIITKKIECEGIVVRSEGPFSDPPQYNVAIFFHEISKAEIKKIAECVDSIVKNSTD